MCSLMAGTLSLTGCKDDDTQSPSDPDDNSNRTPMSFTADVEATRTGTHINAHDAINGTIWMYVWTETDTLFFGCATYTDDVLALDGECLWPDDIEDTVYVTAFYDSIRTADDPSPFTIEGACGWSDYFEFNDTTSCRIVVPGYTPIYLWYQYDKTGTYSDDILIAHNKLTRDKSDLGTVQLTFRHIMANVQFNAMALDDTYDYYITNIVIKALEYQAYSTVGTTGEYGSWASYSEYINELEQTILAGLGEQVYYDWLSGGNYYGASFLKLEDYYYNEELYHGDNALQSVQIFDGSDDSIQVSTTMTQLTDTIDNALQPLQAFAIPGECQVSVEYSIWSKADTTEVDGVEVITPAEQLETITRTGTINLTGNAVNQVLLYLNAYNLYLGGENNENLIPE